MSAHVRGPWVVLREGGVTFAQGYACSCGVAGCSKSVAPPTTSTMTGSDAICGDWAAQEALRLMKQHALIGLRRCFGDANADGLDAEDMDPPQEFIDHWASALRAAEARGRAAVAPFRARERQIHPIVMLLIIVAMAFAVFG